MQLRQLKRRFNADLIFLGTIVLFLVFVNGFLIVREEMYLADYASIQQDIARLESNLNKAKLKLDATNKLYELYKELESEKLPSLKEPDETTDRIREARKFLQALKTKYQLTALDMTLTPPERMADNVYSVGKLFAVSSKVTLKFAGVSDELTLSFIKNLIDEFPGYVRVLDMSLNKVGDVNPKQLAAISLGNFNPLVQGSLTFEWVKLHHESKK